MTAARAIAVGLALVAGLGLGWLGSPSGSGQVAPGRLLTTPETFDMGHCAQGALVSGEVDIRNATDAPVLIGSISTACGCLRASLPAGGRLPPGATCRARFEAETSTAFGEVRNTVMIHTVEPLESTSTFIVLFQIDQGIMTERPTLEFGRVVVGRRATATMILRRVGQVEIPVVRVLLDGRPVSVERKSLPEDAGSRRTQLDISVPGFATMGLHSGQVEVDVGEAGPPLVRRYRALVIDRFVVEPRLLGFGHVVVGEESQERRILIGDALARNLRVHEIAADSPDVWTAQIRGVESGFVVIGVRCLFPKALGPTSGLLRVSLSEPESIRLEIPLRANVVGKGTECVK